MKNIKIVKLLGLFLLIVSCNKKQVIELFVDNETSIIFNNVINLNVKNNSNSSIQLKIKNDTCIYLNDELNFIHYKIYDKNLVEISKDTTIILYNFMSNIFDNKGNEIPPEIVLKESNRNKFLFDSTLNSNEKTFYSLNKNILIKKDSVLKFNLYLKDLFRENFSIFPIKYNLKEGEEYYITFNYKGEIITLNNDKEDKIEIQMFSSPYYRFKAEKIKD